MTDEEAKAVQEVAKASRKALEIAEKAGPFIAGVFGDLVENAVGIVGDQLRYYRLNQFFLLTAKTEKLLAKRNITNPRAVRPKFAIPLIEAATLEDNDDLHSTWARLLANAMDPDGPPIRQAFINILRGLDPDDAHTLAFLYQTIFVTKRTDKTLEWTAPGVLFIDARGLSLRLKIQIEETEIALLNLAREECIHAEYYPSMDEPRSVVGGGAIGIRLTRLGKEFVEACQD